MDLTLLKQFNTERNINSASVSPLAHCPYLIAGGGQDAMAVTTTAAAQGKFGVSFYVRRAARKSRCPPPHTLPTPTHTHTHTPPTSTHAHTHACTRTHTGAT
eukprot:195398-Prymnesium_polylepis.1